LQIGPVVDVDDAKVSALLERMDKYDYAIVGTIGNTLNSKGGAKAFAWALHARATKAAVVDTARGAGAPKFLVGALEGMFGDAHPIIDHVLRIGFRNTNGRASSSNGRFVAGLVSALPTGANYQTVRGVVEASGKAEATITSAHRSIAKAYIADLQQAGPALVFTAEGSNALNGATKQDIEDGYAYILANMEALIGMPVDCFESGAPGNWNPVWATLGSDDLKLRFEATYSKDADLDAKVRAAYGKWKALCRAKPTMGTTPAYDVVGLVAAVCMSEHIDLHQLFDPQDENETVWKLRELGSLGGLMWGCR